MASKHYFDTVAPQWYVLRQDFFSNAVRDQALKTAGVTAGKTALDVGAGSGFISEGLVAGGLQVIAVDQSEKMLAELAAFLPEVDCRVGEASSLPVEDETVDYVFANMYLHHVPNPDNAIREMVRTLRPGGSLIITDLDEHDFEFLRREQHDLWLGFKRTTLRDWFDSAGLGNIVVRSLNENCCAASYSCDQQASVSIFIASGRKTG